MKKVSLRALVCAAIGLTFAEPSTAGTITAVPTNWRLQNYVALHEVVLWNTAASGCTTGKLALTASGALKEDANRLFSLILTAKVAQRSVTIDYDGSGTNCVITAFAIDN